LHQDCWRYGWPGADLLSRWVEYGPCHHSSSLVKLDGSSVQALFHCGTNRSFCKR
jgi:hypothetical protein